MKRRYEMPKNLLRSIYLSTKTLKLLPSDERDQISKLSLLITPMFNEHLTA